jgi:outer membrane protein OmpA-like peptidoglycan-associated protein
MVSLIRRSAHRLSPSASSERHAGPPKGALLLGLLALPLLGGTAWAQSGPVIISGSGTIEQRAPVVTDPTGSVTVDWSVLDTLGPGPRPLSSALVSPKGPIILTPPKAAKHKHEPHAVAKAKPAHTPAPASTLASSVAKASPEPTAEPATVTSVAASTTAAAVEPLMASRVPAAHPAPVSAPEPAATARTASPSGAQIDIPPPPSAPALPPVAAVSEVAPAAVRPVSATASTPSSQPTPLTAPPAPVAEVAPPPAVPAIAPPPAAAAPAPAPTPAEAPQSIASLSSPPSPISLPASVGSPASIVFAADSSQLPSDAKPRLDAIIHSMTGNARLRAQIIAYAAGTPDSASQARRLSLSRALAVRAYMIEKGVASTRLDVRALGHQTDGGSPDRVDIAFAAR